MGESKKKRILYLYSSSLFERNARARRHISLRARAQKVTHLSKSSLWKTNDTSLLLPPTLLPYLLVVGTKKEKRTRFVDFVSNERDVSCARFFLSSLARAREKRRRRKLHFAIRADSRYARFVNAPLFSFILLLSFFSWRDTK